MGRAHFRNIAVGISCTGAIVMAACNSNDEGGAATDPDAAADQRAAARLACSMSCVRRRSARSAA